MMLWVATSRAANKKIAHCLQLLAHKRPNFVFTRSIHATSASPNNDGAKTNSSTTRDNRLAGRRRFYKYVGVVNVDAPWKTTTTASNSSDDSIESPISAGVDDTQSASGVHHLDNNHVDLQWKQKIFLPRRPGIHYSKNDEEDVDLIKWFGITLDGRILKTPMGQTLAVPSELVAWAIAAEWDAQQDYLLPAQMPLMTLACTALDQTAAQPDNTSHALRFLSTDTICYWSDPLEDRVLYRKQQQAWDKLFESCRRAWGNLPAKTVGFQEGLLVSRNAASGLPHPTSVVEGARDFISSLDVWHLTAFNSIASEAKSFLVPFCLLSNDCDPATAIRAARVEEEFQIDIWGLVEGQHDYDRLNCSIQIHAAHLLTKGIALDTGILK